MANDIVTRLRERADRTWTGSDVPSSLMLNAADEIERLRQLTGRLAGLLTMFSLLMTKDEQEMVLEAMRGE